MRMSARSASVNRDRAVRTSVNIAGLFFSRIVSAISARIASATRTARLTAPDVVDAEDMRPADEAHDRGRGDRPSSRSSGGASRILPMNDLRDTPTRTGRPSSDRASRPLSRARLSSRRLPKPMPGSMMMLFAAAGRRPRRPRSFRPGRPGSRRRHRRSGAGPAWSSASPSCASG